MRRVLRAIRHPGESFLQRVLNAGVWAFAMRGASRALHLVRTIILARLLTPGDFGLMALATITLLFLETFTRAGFRNALIQREGDIEGYIDTAWTVEVLRTAATAALLVAGAPLVAAFYGNAEVVPVLRVMAIALLITGLTNMATVYLDRELDFKRVFRFEVAERMTEVLFAVTAGFLLRSVWALVIGAIAGAVGRVVASYVLVPRRPRLEFDRSKALELFRYGRWIYGSIVLWFLTSELDDILVGRLAGAATLGLYRMAYTVSQSLVTEIAQTTNQVVFPAFSRLQSDAARMRAGLVRSIHFIAFIAFPAAAGFLVLGHDLTRVLFGDQWLEMVPALRILSLAAAVKAVAAPVSVMFEGAGRPDMVTRLELGRLVIMAGGLYPAISAYGMEGAAWVTLGASVLVDGATLFVGKRFLDVSPTHLAAAMGWPLANTVVSGAAVAATLLALGPGFGAGGLAAAILAGVVAYGLAVIAASRWLRYRELTTLLASLHAAEGRSR
jgi:O-antigen/teichoic acid export membrane protein